MDRMSSGSSVSQDHPVNPVHSVLNTPSGTCPGWKGFWVPSLELTGCPRLAMWHPNEMRLGAQGWPGDWQSNRLG